MTDENNPMRRVKKERLIVIAELCRNRRRGTGIRTAATVILSILLVIGGSTRQDAQTPSVKGTSRNVRFRPLTPGERLVFNVSWSNVPSAARLEIETSARGTFYGEESYGLKTRVQTLNGGWLLGDIDNLYSTYVGAASGLPFRLINWLRQGRGEVRQIEETIRIDQTGQTASLSTGSAREQMTIPTGTLDLPSLLLALRRQPPQDGGRTRYQVLFNRQVILIEADVVQRRRLETSLGSFNSLCIRLLPRKYSQFQTMLWLTDDEERTPLLIRAGSPLGELRAELTSTTSTRPGGAEPPSLGPNSMASVAPSDIFKIGERLGYEISWGNFINIGRASFEIRQQGLLNNQPVIELHGEASSIGVARALLTVNDQISSVVDARQLTPLRSEISLREGRRSKFDVATFNSSAGTASLSNGTVIRLQPGTLDLLSLFYNLRALNLKPGESRILNLLNANHRPQTITVRGASTESVDGRSTTRIEILNGENALLATGWITTDQQRLPLKFTSRLPIGELLFKLVSVGNN